MRSIFLAVVFVSLSFAASFAAEVAINIEGHAIYVPFPDKMIQAGMSPNDLPRFQNSRDLTLAFVADGVSLEGSGFSFASLTKDFATKDAFLADYPTLKDFKEEFSSDSLVIVSFIPGTSPLKRMYRGYIKLHPIVLTIAMGLLDASPMHELSLMDEMLLWSIGISVRNMAVTDERFDISTLGKFSSRPRHTPTYPWSAPSYSGYYGAPNDEVARVVNTK